MLDLGLLLFSFVCAARVPEPAEAGGSNPGVIHQEQRVEAHAKQEPTQESAQSGDSGEQFLRIKSYLNEIRVTIKMLRGILLCMLRYVLDSYIR
jgi:hypothetical protein